ncbi:MAG: hypothetical protein IPL97_00080 [Niastella sp.]|nr:hypothetical protein [Niastella sp.]
MFELSKFSKEQQDWLKSHPTLHIDLFEEFEDQTNLNPLENGEKDLRYDEITITVVKTTISAAGMNIIEGPYDNSHFQMIKRYFNDLPVSEKKFWELFSINCAFKNDEGEFSKERLYMHGICEIVKPYIVDDEVVDECIGNTELYDLGSEKAMELKFEGVDAKWV